MSGKCPNFAAAKVAQMAESVDALVSNTSGATRAGSTPALGTESGGRAIGFRFSVLCKEKSNMWTDLG